MTDEEAYVAAREKLVDAAAEASEVFGDDELERFAAEQERSR